MAKATKKVETEENKKAHIIDKVTAGKAMEIVGKPLKAVNASFDELADMPSAGKAQRTLCATFFAYGMAMRKDASLDKAKAEEVEKRYVERFDTFAAKHWDDASPGTVKGYRSQFKAFYEAAFAKHDMTSAVRSCLEIANVQMPWRSGRIRELIDHDGKLTASVIAETLDPAEADQTKKGGEARFKALVNLAVNTAANAEFGKWLNSQPEIAAWAKPALKRFTAYQATVAESMDKGAQKSNMLKAVGAAKITIDAAVVAAKATRPARAPRGATIN